jgi:hypothetical protein
MKSGTMASHARADDNHVVIELLRRAIARRRSHKQIAPPVHASSADNISLDDCRLQSLPDLHVGLELRCLGCFRLRNKCEQLLIIHRKCSLLLRFHVGLLRRRRHHTLELLLDEAWSTWGLRLCDLHDLLHLGCNLVVHVRSASTSPMANCELVIVIR